MLEARNKNIVRLLEEKGNIIENRHTGIATMREEMAKQVNLSKDGVKYHINILKSKGIVERMGTNKKGYWKVLQQNK